MNPKEPVFQNLAAEIVNGEPPKIAREEKIDPASIVHRSWTTAQYLTKNTVFLTWVNIFAMFLKWFWVEIWIKTPVVKTRLNCLPKNAR